MRAIEQDRLGGPEVLKLVDVERPGPGPAHLLRNYLRYFRPRFHPDQIPAPA